MSEPSRACRAYLMLLASLMGTLLGTNISPSKGTFESMMFLFPFGGICIRSLNGYILQETKNRLDGNIPPFSNRKYISTRFRWQVLMLRPLKSYLQMQRMMSISWSWERLKRKRRGVRRVFCFLFRQKADMI